MFKKNYFKINKKLVNLSDIKGCNDPISLDDRASEFQDASFLTKRITRVLDSTYDMAEIESLMPIY